jgi:hypothetical protein
VSIMTNWGMRTTMQMNLFSLQNRSYCVESHDWRRGTVQVLSHVFLYGSLWNSMRARNSVRSLVNKLSDICDCASPRRQDVKP